MEYDDPTAETTAEVSGPAGAVGKRKKSSDATAGAPQSNQHAVQSLSNNQGATPGASQKAKTETGNEKDEKQKIHEEKDRAKTFKKNHPGVTGIPDRMDKALFKQLTQKHGKDTKPKPKSKKKHNKN